MKTIQERAQFVLGAGTQGSYYVPARANVQHATTLLAEATPKFDRLRRTRPKEREALSQTILALKQYTSPMRLLPTELLQTIFSLAVPVSAKCLAWDTNSEWWKGHQFLNFHELENELTSQQSVEGPFFGDMLQSPWNISHVCRRWRDITLDTPRLWTYFNICVFQRPVFASREYRRARPACSLLELASKRSGSLGLDIIFQNNKSTVPAALDHNILNTLHNHKDRWQRLYAANVELDFSLLGCGADSFEETFSGLKAIGLSDYKDIFDCGVKFPNLETWYCLMSSCDWGYEDYDFPWPDEARGAKNWSGVIGASGDPIPLDRLECHLQVLSTLEHLTTLQLGINGCKMDDSNPPGTHGEPEPGACVLFPNLINLSLGLYQANSQDKLRVDVLGMVSTPSLRSLQLSSLDEPKALIPLLNRSSCSLTSLRINNACLNTGDISDILDHTPHIEQLYVSFVATLNHAPQQETDRIGVISDTLLERLCDTTTRSYLRELHFLHMRELNLDMMLRIFENRLSLGLLEDYPLKRIVLSLSGYDGDVLESRYKNLLRSLRLHHWICIQLEPWE